MQVMNTMHANGKLLLTGEYLVLVGAKALAVPLVVGQKLVFEEISIPGVLHWEAYDTDGKWFSAKYYLPEITEIEASDYAVSARLIKLLQAARLLNPDFLYTKTGISVITELEFNRNYGFGSSSTLIGLIAGWAGIDAMQLHRNVSKGSGYDVACSNSDRAIFYSLTNGLPMVEAVDFNPPFAENMFLVYLGAKQHSDLEVEAFTKSTGIDYSIEIERLSRISDLIASEKDIYNFISLLTEHEAILSKVLNRATVKSRLFPEFEGAVKSLGAWGGDFILAVSALGKDYIKDYFSSKMHNTVIPYDALNHNRFDIKAVQV